VEASALQAPAGVSRLSLGPLLRLRSDDQLVAAFRAGSDDAFTTLHGRYQQRLFAYARQMLGGSRQDAEDVLQDVFVRAYGALRADHRDVNVRAWLYRVAHNRCIDQLRRPTPPASEIFEMSRKPLHDPFEQAQRREDLRRLVHDVGRLPDQQRSALLMREIDGLSYADLAVALDTSVPAVKSLLVRARVGLVEAVEARDMDCSIIRGDLMEAYDRGVKASGRARRHMRECDSCREYRTALRQVQRSLALLSPLGAGPLAIAAKLLGLGGASAGGGAAASAGAGGGFAVSTGIGAVSACKVAAVVCTAAIATGGAVEVKKTVDRVKQGRAHVAAASTGAPSSAARPEIFSAKTTRESPPFTGAMASHSVRPEARTSPSAPASKRHEKGARGAPLFAHRTPPHTAAPAAGLPVADEQPAEGDLGTPVENPTGGVSGPEEYVPEAPSPSITAEPGEPVVAPASGAPETSPSAAPVHDPGAVGGAGAPAAKAPEGVAALHPTR